MPNTATPNPTRSRHDPSPTGGPAGPGPRHAGRGSVLRRPAGRTRGR
ncbi:MAG: hypothetical protein VYD63_07295, partial [Actinomycetota bacterium]|nr:hypothetical protein [Actinomycetota bacterium]